MRDPISFSVVTPSFNQVPFIERTIRSVLAQEVPGLEYLVMDGGSFDGSVEILQRYASANLLCYRSERDGGQADAVNKGIALTTGSVIGWLNSDDVYYPGALAAVREYFASFPDVDVVYGEADHIDEQDRLLEPYACEPWDQKRLADVCYLCQPAVFFRRRVVEQHGGLDAALQYCMDYEFWLRLAQRGARFAFLPRKLAGSRMYAWNKTMGQRVRVHAEINDMLRRRLGAVPQRWVSNYAHVLLEGMGVTREPTRRFTMSVAALTWWADLRWNGRISPEVRRTTSAWVTAALQQRRASVTTAVRRSGANGRSQERQLRVGIDVSQTGSRKAGCGYFALELTKAIGRLETPHEYMLYSTFGDAFWDPAGPEATWMPDDPRMKRWPGASSPAAARTFWRTSHPDRDRALGEPDIVHSHNFFCPSDLRKSRLVYTLYDLNFLTNPEWTTEANRQACFTGVFRASQHGDFVLAISKASRAHFLEAFPHYPEERTAIVYPASRFASAQPVRRPSSCAQLQPGRFLLNVGTVEPRKNLARLLEAYARYVAQRAEPMPLVLAGGTGWMMEQFDHQLESRPLVRHVRRMGYVSDDVLQWLYQNCHAFLYPSLFEGFGLPVLEALSQGAAVLTSRTSSMPEVAGDAALYVDPFDVLDIEAGLTRLTADADLVARLRGGAQAQAARFSWHTAAERTLASYARAMELPRFDQLAAVASVG